MKKHTLIILIALVFSGVILSFSYSQNTKAAIETKSATVATSWTATWTPVSGATSYKIQIFEGATPDLTKPILEQELTATSFSTGSLDLAKTYYYRVSATISTFGPSAWSKLFPMTVIKPIESTKEIVPTKPIEVIPVMPVETPAGTVTIDPIADTITINPGPEAGQTQTEDTITINLDDDTVTIDLGGEVQEEALLTDEQIFKLITENNFVEVQEETKFLGIRL
ncbi:hypothetical protein KKB58_02185, partial [Patescibacteria group bacterium]|nr:hypothetical protein [Patescibacteria group bacterium]